MLLVALFLVYSTVGMIEKEICLAMPAASNHIPGQSMAEPIKLTRIPALKTVAEFRAHVASLGIELPCEDTIATGAPRRSPSRSRRSPSTASTSATATPSSPWKAGTARPAAASPRMSSGAGADSVKAAPS